MLKTEKECIDFIHSAGRFGKKAGLCNIKALLDILGNPHRDLKCIHIAGTNGKGSVSCMLANILTAGGFKVGMNTSPYIERFNERLKINGEDIPAQKLVYYTNLVAEAIEKLNDVHPIEFEIITAIGFLYFRDEKCDYAVIECGLGGLYDCTNVIENPVLTVITQIGIDHTEILGDTIEQIAFQKAGIIKRSCPVAVHPLIDEAALSVIRLRAEQMCAPLYEAPGFTVMSADLEGTRLLVDGIKLKLNLPGSYQASNAALAVKSAKLMGMQDVCIEQGIEQARWKCRFERVSDNIIIDGAHNYQGICSFAESVDLYVPPTDRVILIGMLNDKDFDASACRLSELEGRFIVTDVPSYRQTDGMGVYECISRYIPDAVYVRDYAEALARAKELAGDSGFICIAGSLYLAGAMRTLICN
ncbi:MAG: bifunctional folylpolyglutamate synthase/dihydrofolate synthase [Clostridia bacterium]|nr:bifunctional folylpolyglutamate synthase/dihydrofolate synthase [Clostridia bacterium]